MAELMQPGKVADLDDIRGLPPERIESMLTRADPAEMSRQPLPGEAISGGKQVEVFVFEQDHLVQDPVAAWRAKFQVERTHHLGFKATMVEPDGGERRVKAVRVVAAVRPEDLAPVYLQFKKECATTSFIFINLCDHNGGGALLENVREQARRLQHTSS